MATIDWATGGKNWNGRPKKRPNRKKSPWQERLCGKKAKAFKRIGLKRKQSPKKNWVKAQILRKREIRIATCEKPETGGRQEKSSLHGKCMNSRQDSDTNTRKAQAPPACTQPIQDMVRSWVRGKRAWFGGRERGRLILRFLPRLFRGYVLLG